jgi:hypothetical protein
MAKSVAPSLRERNSFSRSETNTLAVDGTFTALNTREGIEKLIIAEG